MYRGIAAPAWDSSPARMPGRKSKYRPIKEASHLVSLIPDVRFLISLLKKHQRQNIIKENLGNDIKVDVKNSNERLVIEVIKKHKFLIIKKDYNIKIKYYGYLINDKIAIEKG